MPTNFKRLRRKIGVLTLLMACGLTWLWIRSPDFEDEFVAVIGKSRACFASQAGWFSCWLWIERTRSTTNETLLNWHSQPTLEHTIASQRGTGRNEGEKERIVIISYIDLSYRRQAEDREQFHELLNGEPDEVQITKLELPCVSVVVPLTLLSAYLLISKTKPSPGSPHV